MTAVTVVASACCPATVMTVTMFDAWHWGGIIRADKRNTALSRWTTLQLSVHSPRKKSKNTVNTHRPRKGPAVLCPSAVTACRVSWDPRPTKVYPPWSVITLIYGYSICYLRSSLPRLERARGCRAAPLAPLARRREKGWGGRLGYRLDGYKYNGTVPNFSPLSSGLRSTRSRTELGVKMQYLWHSRVASVRRVRCRAPPPAPGGVDPRGSVGA